MLLQKGGVINETCFCIITRFYASVYFCSVVFYNLKGGFMGLFWSPNDAYRELNNNRKASGLPSCVAMAKFMEAITHGFVHTLTEHEKRQIADCIAKY